MSVTVIDQFLSLVNTANQETKTTLKDGDVTVVSVTAGEFGAKNTEVVLRGVPERGYQHEVTVRHDRLDMSLLVPAETGVALLRDNSETIHDVLLHLSVEHGLTFEESEFADAPIDVFAASSIRLAPVDNSLKYNGHAQIVLTIKDSTMASVVTTTDLPGFVASKYVDMLVYSRCRGIPHDQAVADPTLDYFFSSTNNISTADLSNTFRRLLPTPTGENWYTASNNAPWSVYGGRRVYTGPLDRAKMPEETKDLIIKPVEGFPNVAIDHFPGVGNGNNIKGYTVLFYKPKAA